MQKQKWALYLLMLLKLPNNAWKVQRGPLKERSLKKTPTSFILLDVLVSLPDTHSTLGQSGPHDAIPFPLYTVRQFSAVRTQVCASSPRSTQLVCLVPAWGQSKWQDFSVTEVRARAHPSLHMFNSVLYPQTRGRRGAPPYVCLAVCCLTFVRSCYPPTSPQTVRLNCHSGCIKFRDHHLKACVCVLFCIRI